MTYKISYLPAARQDMRELAQYWIEQYSAMDAALNLLDEIERQIRHLAEFPYSHSLYRAPMKLPSEIRYLPVKNHIMFYAVLEPERIVEIRRVLYERMNITDQKMN